MSYIRSFDDFTPPRRFDSIPFVSVEIEEGSVAEGPFTLIDTQLLSPVDTDPAEPISRSLTTDDAVLDPGWYVLVWKDNAGGQFASDPVYSGEPGPGLSSFITRNELADYLHRPEIVDDDAAGAAVDGACAICRTFAEQTFNLIADDAIVLDGTGTDALLLPELPVLEVSAVAIAGTAQTVTDDYVLNGNGVLLRPAFGWWPRARQNIAVTYTHGYGPDEMPRDVKMVALTIAARLFTSQGGAGIRSEQLGSYRIDYTSGTSAGGDLTAGERAILRKYRRAK